MTAEYGKQEVFGMPKASVIVPVYNVEKYLEKCVKSILAQTERDFEVLLVDDGSTDGSGALCGALAEQDSRIRVIHQENRGLGGARNTGIRAAAGKWLLLVDSDDWIEPDILEKAMEAGERENADLVMFSMRSVNEVGEELHLFTENVPKNVGLTLAEQKDILLTSPSACNKLYRKDLFLRTGLEYPPKVWYEDLRTTPKLMAKAGRMVFLDHVGYNYFQRTGSIMKSSDVSRNGEILDVFDDVLPWFREQGLFEPYREELEFLVLSNAYLQASVRVIKTVGKHPLLARFASYLEENFPNFRKNKYRNTLNRKQRLILRLLDRKMYAFASLIFKIKG